ncbi:MAG: NADH-quinone oxidoreductase subunit J [Acidobacteria bacterium]|nr:MAG: NADH-quinone oxidoreductase subunit J [Acidobacteriota bacterium]
MEAIFFYILAVIVVVFAVFTVTARNPVRSAVYLISALIAIAGLFLLQEAEFVAAVQILVYVGGIMVLFLFVIMLVNVREAVGQPTTNKQTKTAVVLAAVLGGELIFFLTAGARLFEVEPDPAVIAQAQTLNTESVGTVLYTTYLLPFEIASVLLLVAIVGAVVLAKKTI